MLLFLKHEEKGREENRIVIVIEIGYLINVSRREAF